MTIRKCKRCKRKKVIADGFLTCGGCRKPLPFVAAGCQHWQHVDRTEIERRGRVNAFDHQP